VRREIRLSGFGGQGIMLAAVILGRAAVMYDGKYAVQTQVYGPEARGGASMAQVVIDDAPILYPKVEDPDLLVIMSQEGFEKYGRAPRPDALMLIDRGLVHSRPICPYLEIPATEDARSVLKKVIVANIVMLGALVASTGVVSREAIERAVLDQVPKGTEDLNLAALKQGYVRGEEAQR
jgi:2-oxoglutarate ferredoxin oxidoreductase subunit gamma